MTGEGTLKSLYLSAAELPPEQVGTFLDRECRGDVALRAQVERLLEARKRAGGFIAEPTAVETVRGAGSAAVAGMMVGNYKVLEQIGEGGFGTVYLAEQQRPVVRRVALKILREDHLGRDVMARFEAERQALALMDHPHIAKILDAGTDEAGRPYFVMDLVVGLPITQYCDEHQLSIRERLRLFEQVCLAAQHAHTKGVMHRDIKPSNVLVSTRDGKAHATIIDFGIAKATQSRLTTRTLFTAHRAFIGTPEYMSPEQVNNSPDIDTRTDVYSLGILLYELLTGSTPFGEDTLKDAGLAEVIRVIREVDPPKPSTRLAQMGVGAASRTRAPSTPVTGQPPGGGVERVAKQRKSDPKTLAGFIRGELDWIVMKSIDKDRSRRYPTANALASDIRRYLSGLAVSAAPPSAWYWASKVVRRHRAVAGMAAVGMLAVTATAVVAVFGWRNALAKSNELEQKNREIAERSDERNVALKEAQLQREIAERLRDDQQAATRLATFATYAANIHAADMAVEKFERERAGESLRACPDELRGWEHHYLAGRDDSSIHTYAAHRPGVLDVAISPDGRLLATCGADAAVSIWSVQGERLVLNDRHSDDVTFVRFSADASRLLTASDDGSVRLWNSSTGEGAGTVVEGASYGVTSCAWGASDATVVLGCSDGEVRVFDTPASGAVSGEPRVLPGHAGDVAAVAVAPDGGSILSVGSDGLLIVREVSTGKVVTRIETDEGGLASAVFMPDGVHVACGTGNGQVMMWDTAASRREWSKHQHDGGVVSLAASPDGKTLAVGVSMVAFLLDAGSGERVGMLMGHDKAVTGVAFSPDSAFVVTGSWDGTARLWDARDRGDRWVFDGRVTSESRGISPDATRLVVVDGLNVDVRDLATGDLLAVFGVPNVTPWSVSFTPDGDALLVHVRDDESRQFTGDAVVLDAWSGRVVRRLRPLSSFLSANAVGPGGYHAAAFSPDGRLVAVPSSGWKADVYDWEKGERAYSLIGHENAVNGVSFSDDGGLIGTVSADGTARLWSAKDGARLEPALTCGDGGIESLDFSRGGGSVAAIGHDHSVSVWRTSDRTRVGRVVLQDPAPEVLDLAEDASLVLVRESGGVVRLWDVAAGRQVSTLSGTFPSDTRMTISGEGSRLLSTSADRTVRVWNSESGAELLALEKHGAATTFAQFAGDGSMVVTCDGSRTLLWDARRPEERSGALEQAARARESMSAALRPRFARKDMLRDIRADVVRNRALTGVERCAAMAMITERALQMRRESAECDAPLPGVAQSGDGPDAALGAARRAHDADPRDWRRSADFGVALYERGDYKEAADALALAQSERWDNELGESPRVLAFDAMCRYRLGMGAGAAAAVARLDAVIHAEHNARCGAHRFLELAQRTVTGGGSPDAPTVQTEGIHP